MATLGDPHKHRTGKVRRPDARGGLEGARDLAGNNSTNIPRVWRRGPRRAARRGGAASWTYVAHRLAEQRSPTGLYTQSDIFRQAFRDLGYIEGRNIALEFRWTEEVPIGFPCWRPNWLPTIWT